MCLANKFLTRFEELAEDVEKEYLKLSKLQSVYDKKLSAHYHKVEGSKFNAAEGFYLAKELQDILRQRRVIKTELHRVRNLRASLNINSIKDATQSARKCLKKVYSNEEKNGLKHDWVSDYRVEDLELHIH